LLARVDFNTTSENELTWCIEMTRACRSEREREREREQGLCHYKAKTCTVN
jgi:hypothetical protein